MVEFEPREEFDGYRIDRLLGKGGMGAVYLATDMLLQRKVAIKFIITDEDATAQQRFLIEARAIARLQHPNVVSIYRVGELDGYPYLVSEFIRGTPLNEIKRPISYRMALGLSIGISCALSAAHQKGVLHRDLKPANAILSNDGVVKLLDFGVAKLVWRGRDSHISSLPPMDGSMVSLDEEGQIVEETIRIKVDNNPQFESLTDNNMIMGTPHFMAPELWTGAPASFQSDIYGFGMLIYTLLCEKSPHKGSDIEALRLSIMTVDPPPLHESAPHVNKQFGAIIDKCLRRDPALRFFSINEVRKRLERLAEDSTETVPEGNPYRGLNYFDIAHRRLFFGRDSEIRMVLEKMETEPFVLVAGDMGVGKSSLCRAGVLSRMPTWGDDSRLWRAAQLLPGRSPLRELAAMLSSLFQAPKDVIIKALTTDPGGVARDLLAVQESDRGLVIFIDQFEEFVTVSDPEEIDDVMTFLSWLVMPSDCVRVLATVRGDFLSRLAGLPHIGDKISNALFFLRNLSEERIEEVIVGPAEEMGASFESSGLVRRLVEDTLKLENALPLLQFTLMSLWDKKDSKSHVIMESSLDEIGGVQEALRRHADSVLDSLHPLERAAAKDILLRLISSQKNQVRKTLEELNVDSKVERQAVDTLVRSGLLVILPTAGDETFALSHVSLVDAWPALSGWFSTDAKTRWILERLGNAARIWHRSGRSNIHLWSHHRFHEMQWLSSAKLGDTERAFIAASKAAARRLRLKKWGAILIVPSIALLVVLVLELKQHIVKHGAVDTAIHSADENHRIISDSLKNMTLLHQQAFDAFENGHIKQGAALWNEYRQKQQALLPRFQEYGHELEQAVLIDPSRSDIKERYAQYLVERADFAELRGAFGEYRSFAERVSLYRANHRMVKVMSPSEIKMRVSKNHARIFVYELSGALGFDINHPRLKNRMPDESFVLPAGEYLARVDAGGFRSKWVPFVVKGKPIVMDVSLEKIEYSVWRWK